MTIQIKVVNAQQQTKSMALVNGSNLTVTHGDTIRLLSRENFQTVRKGNDLIIKNAKGEEFALKDFYAKVQNADEKQLLSWDDELNQEKVLFSADPPEQIKLAEVNTGAANDATSGGQEVGNASVENSGTGTGSISTGITMAGIAALAVGGVAVASSNGGGGNSSNSGGGNLADINTTSRTITDVRVNVAPIITSGDSATVAENTTGVVYQAVATDSDGDNITYSLSGADADWFNIDVQTGAVSFKNAPDYEAHHPPTDGTPHIMIYPFIDNTYNINVIASDGMLSTKKAVTITVADVYEASVTNHAPIISSGDSATVAENATCVVYQAVATDPEGDNITYSLSGADADWFNIDVQTGAVSFKNAPDYEAHHPPTDGTPHIMIYPFIDNTYDINVIASDGELTTEKAVTITVTNVEEGLLPVRQLIIGTSTDDMLIGTQYNENIIGLAGKDSLTGGIGRDVFIFKEGLLQEDGSARIGFDPHSVDIINYFVSGEDSIGFKNGSFVLSENSTPVIEDLLVQGAGAVSLDANNYFIFDSNNAALYFDADGNGAGSAEHFATLYGVASLAASDIIIYASDVIL